MTLTSSSSVLQVVISTRTLEGSSPTFEALYRTKLCAGHGCLCLWCPVVHRCLSHALAAMTDQSSGAVAGPRGCLRVSGQCLLQLMLMLHRAAITSPCGRASCFGCFQCNRCNSIADGCEGFRWQCRPCINQAALSLYAHVGGKVIDLIGRKVIMKHLSCSPACCWWQ